MGQPSDRNPLADTTFTRTLPHVRPSWLVKRLCCSGRKVQGLVSPIAPRNTILYKYVIYLMRIHTCRCRCNYYQNWGIVNGGLYDDLDYAKGFLWKGDCKEREGTTIVHAGQTFIVVSNLQAPTTAKSLVEWWEGKVWSSHLSLSWIEAEWLIQSESRLANFPYECCWKVWLMVKLVLLIFCHVCFLVQILHRSTAKMFTLPESEWGNTFAGNQPLVKTTHRDGNSNQSFPPLA